MKPFSSKVLIFVIILSSFTVSGQQEVPDQILGVTKGQTFDYVVTAIFGVDDPLFTDGFNNMSLETGDTFKLSVIDDNPSIGGTIDLELWNSDVNITYANQLNFFDFVVYKDWEFWKNILAGAGFDSYLDDKIFSFAYLLEDQQNARVIYLEYTYDVKTGLNTHQLTYIAPRDDIQSPISFVQIDLGKTVMPRADLSNIGFNIGEFYSYEMLQIDGFGNDVIFEGLEGGLILQTGDEFLVSPLGEEPGAANSILATIQSPDGAIIYQNRLDFLNSINSPAFFIYNDWEYVKAIADRFIDEQREGVTISYEFTADQFIYEEDSTYATGYYSLELIYDLTTGALAYESYFIEDTVTGMVQITEFTLRDIIKIDEAKVNFEIKRPYEYELVNYQPLSNTVPLFRDDNDNDLFVFEGEKFTITPQTRPDSDNLVPVRISNGEKSLIIFNQLDTLGSFFVLADWDYWVTIIELIQEFSVEGLEITYQQDDDTFTIFRSIDILSSQSNEEIVYDKATGVLKKYSFAATGVDENGKAISVNLEFKLIGNPGGDSKEDDSPAFLLPLGIFTLLTAVIFRRKFKK